MSALNAEAITEAVLGLDQWFDAMRVDWPTPGYGGPVAHWWNHCLGYQGTGLDWRYEGIIAGYLTLWRRTREQRWLDKAVRAGDDLVAGQLPDGNFVASQFEANPGSAGTPHESACSVGLLLLARELESVDAHAAARFRDCAASNLEQFSFGKLWHAPTGTLWDREGVDSFVPNKAATFAEAVMLLAELSGRADLIERYVIPTSERILSLQVNDPKDRLHGAIAQNILGGQVVRKYFSLYIARCVPALVAASAATGERRFWDGAQMAVNFLVTIRDADGGFPQVLYGNGRANRYPRWVAGAGDIVRAFSAVAKDDERIDATPTVNWILQGRRSDGHIVTADGFERILPIISRRDKDQNELGVVGWCDKAFRVLAHIVDASSISAPLGPSDTPTASTIPQLVMR